MPCIKSVNLVCTHLYGFQYNFHFYTNTQLIFGCGGLGEEFKGEEAAAELLKTLKELGIRRLDTAALYPPTDIGASQRLLGKTEAARSGFTVDTKVMISIQGIKHSLEPEKIAKSAEASRKILNFPDGQRIGVYYAHDPDVATPLAEQAAGFNAQYKKGLFDKLGVCNFLPEMLAEFIDIYEREGYVKPIVYQGVYNILSRQYEGQLFDLIRKHGMTFVVHSTLASGFLRGSLTSGQVEGTRFAPGNIMSMNARRYDQEKYHDVVRLLDEKLEPHGIPKTDAALRWVAIHSPIGPQDAIILGGSKIAQLKKNMAAIAQVPLTDDIVEVRNNV
ncbi:putative aldo/keto reductase [Thozetella sp. PMI_491]|nr:putative aldo/keto reductase [Thozetella sp. PMI_491]